MAKIDIREIGVNALVAVGGGGLILMGLSKIAAVQTYVAMISDNVIGIDLRLVIAAAVALGLRNQYLPQLK